MGKENNLILFENYKKLRREQGLEMNEQVEKALKFIAFSLSDGDARLRNSLISKMRELYNNDPMDIKRFVDVPCIISIMEPINELVEAYEDFDFDNIRNIEINGNNFEYNAKNINILDIFDKLFLIGEKVKEKYFCIDFDEDGSLLITE